MTYNVFGGTLNLAQLLNCRRLQKSHGLDDRKAAFKRLNGNNSGCIVYKFGEQVALCVIPYGTQGEACLRTAILRSLYFTVHT